MCADMTMAFPEIGVSLGSEPASPWSSLSVRKARGGCGQVRVMRKERVYIIRWKKQGMTESTKGKGAPQEENR